MDKNSSHCPDIWSDETVVYLLVHLSSHSNVYIPPVMKFSVTLPVYAAAVSAAPR